MELVYLWVEENDLIKRTNFNFGSKYIFSFEKDNKEDKGVLSVKDNPNFIENFYTNNINISAILGKNGTGKSQLLRLIWNADSSKVYFAIILNNGYYEIIGGKSTKGQRLGKLLKNNIVITLEKNFFHSITNKNLNLTNLFYTNESICLDGIVDIDANIITNNFKLISHECNLKNIIDESDESYNLIKSLDKNFYAYKYSVEDYQESSDNEIDEDTAIDIEEEIRTLKDVILNKITYDKIKSILNSKIFEKTLNIIYDKKISWYKDMKKPISIKLSIEDNYELEKKSYRNFAIDDEIPISDKVLVYYTRSYSCTNEKERQIYKDIYLKKTLESIKEKNNILKEMQQVYEYKDDKNKVRKFSSAKKYFEILEVLYTKIQELEDLNNNYLNVSINEINKSLILEISKYHTQLILERNNIKPILNFQFHPLMSSGNLATMQTFSMLYDEINQIQDDNILLLLDEVEVYLHPNWQKKFLKLLIDFLSSKFKDKKFHVILATHSPFLLSDIPKSNVVFLGDKKIELKQTFGANIHTLLSDSFFMEDGLMGEFAKNKIRTIKVAHRYILHRHKRKTLFTQSSKRCRRLLIKQLPKFRQIQGIIGEPFLQKIVKNQLEEMELILLGKDEAIDNEIARLQALKASLR